MYILFLDYMSIQTTCISSTQQLYAASDYHIVLGLNGNNIQKLVSRNYMIFAHFALPRFSVSLFFDRDVFLVFTNIINIKGRIRQV